jgi:hypothetical protein
MKVPKNDVRIKRHRRRKGRNSLQNEGANAFNIIETCAIDQKLPDAVRLVTRIAKRDFSVNPAIRSCVTAFYFYPDKSGDMNIR